MRIPYSIQGALFGLAFIGLSLVLKVMCPVSPGAGCLTDHLAIPIFLPLLFVYNTIGGGIAVAYELWFMLLYWSLVGFLVGLIFDLRSLRSKY